MGAQTKGNLQCWMLTQADSLKLQLVHLSGCVLMSAHACMHNWRLVAHKGKVHDV